MGKWILLLFMIIYHTHSCASMSASLQKCDLINLMTDFLIALKQPLKITSSALCWNKKEYFQLTSKVIQAGFMVTPSKGYLTTYWPHEQQIFIFDLSCPNATNMLHEASNDKLLEHPFKWLIVENPLNPLLPPELDMFVRSKVYIILQFAGKYNIVSKYRLGKASKPYFTNDIATWQNGTFLYFNRLTDARNRTNLMLLDLNVTMVILHDDTRNHLLDTRDKHIEPFTKVSYPLTLHAFEFVNATPHFKDWTTWGYAPNAEGRFDGMLGDLQNDVADVCSTPLFQTKYRIPYMDAIAPTCPSRAAFVFRAPPLSYVQNIYVLPFTFKVWLVSFGFIAVTPIIFYIISYWEQNSQSFNKYVKSTNSVSRLLPKTGDLIQLQIGALCQQGSEAEPISRSGRITTMVLFITTLFLYTSYSANIVALLQSTTNSIDNLHALLNSRLSLGIEDIPYNTFFFENADGDIQKAIYNEKVAPPGKPKNYLPLQEGIEKMQNEYFAFHTEVTTIYKVVGDTFQEYEKCSLMQIEYFNLFEPYYVIKRNTTYGELFRAALSKMNERGIVHRTVSNLYVKKPTCQGGTGIFLSVSLRDCYAAFFLFGIGVSSAMCVLAAEIIYQKRMNPNILSKSDRVT